MRDPAPPRRRCFPGSIASRVLAAALFASLAGCATDRAPAYPDTIRLEREYRIERVRKRDGDYTVHPSGHVRFASGDTVRLYRERADDLLILEPVDPDGPAQLTRPVLPTLAAVSPPHRGALQLRDIGDGLPRSGQWSERFTLADVDARPGLEIVSATPRKSLGGPRVLGFDAATGWSRVPLPFPPRRYDYGSATSGDFDGDGRADIALAMHLVGFAAFLAAPDGMHEVSGGLPQRATTPPSPVSPATGRMLLARPHPGGDRLLLLREGMDSDRGIGLRELRLHDGTWQDTGFNVDRVTGDRMALSSTPRCGTWLAVADIRVAGPHLWRHDGTAWQEQPFTVFPTHRTRIADLAFGDFDGDGCDDLAVAYSPHTAAGWLGSVDVFLANRDADAANAWHRVPVWQQPGPTRPNAVGLLRTATGAAAHLAVLDTLGGLRVFTHTDVGIVIDVDEAAPAWRSGCQGRAVAAGDVDGDGAPEWIASFAGEPTSFEPARCRNGGGLAAWKP